ncbi:MAG: RNA polymerase sigma factor [Prevotella sp.]|jgi:RNA polymerase sigma-70 factor (ECF subfamily)|nr:RNA polymerase sigma factor [Prevotella sp.]
MNALSDISLVTQVAVFHNKRAFDQLVRKYQSPVRRFFLNLTLGDTQLSDDLAQDTFLKAYTNIASFRGKASFSTWLYRIAYNVFYDYKRAQRTTDDIEQPAIRANFSTNAASAGLKIDIHQAMQLLRDDERTCVTLQLVEGQPIDAIAQITGITVNTVKSHLARGKQKLANYLKENGYG